MKKGIVDVRGIKVGHAADEIAKTGCTVVLCENGAVTGVDIRGGAPGSRETDLLDPMNLVEKVHGIVLAGGSAFGLDAASGVMEYLEERQIGFYVGVTYVPIVPCSVLFDLHVGDFKVRPDKKMGYAACLNAHAEEYGAGLIGAGRGATVGKALGHAYSMKGGLGTWSESAAELIVGAIVVVNAFGDVVNPATGQIIAGARRHDDKKFLNAWETMKQFPQGLGGFAQNTTLGIIATNAILSKAGSKKVAGMAHDAFARTIRPVHTQYDGDTIYAMSTGEIQADINVVGILAIEAMEKAVIQAVTAANRLQL